MSVIQMKRILPMLLCGVLAAMCPLGPAAHAQQSLRRAPSWALADYNGQWHDLLDYRGKVLILDLMKTTCPHCATFADVLAQLPQKYGDKVAVVAIVSPTADNPEMVKQYIAGHKVTYPILFDVGQMQASYVMRSSVDLPHVYVIDQNGYIRADYGYGLTTRDIFEGKALFNEIDRLVGTPSKK
jgi:thiol-disulfide isomerase/thioredoxin